MGEGVREKQDYILELQEVHKDFDGLQVLFGVDLRVRHGERHAIIGPNGAGKSTIFNLITGKFPVSRGKILFKGKEITGAPSYKLNRQGLARSFQITNIFRTMTVFQNVRNAVLSKNRIRYNLFSPLAGMEAIARQTEEVLGQIGLLDRKDVVAGLLSYGEQRALEIGLTIATEPELILLDEPTAGMSSEETREAVKLIERVTAGRALIIVEHDMEVVFSLANRITVLYYGEVLASGPPEEIRSSQKVKDAYLGEEKEEA
jgi:branched-chain amino acid transport system ATP-binding protein